MPSALLKEGSVYRSPLLDALEWLEHGFGTRNTGGWPDRSRLVSLKQTHSDVVRIADGALGCIGEGDALATDRPGLLLGVKTADCLPILLADRERRVVAAVHAGWRGTARGIVRRTVETLRRSFSCQPEDLVVAIGPGIGVCCYEVGPEVADRFRSLLPELDGAQGSVRLDLVEANRRELIAAGVAAERVWTADLCTCCCPEEFHSHRREPLLRGRMWSVIGIRKP